MRISLLLILLLALSAGALVIGEIPFNEVGKGAVDRLMGHSSKWNALIDERLPRLIVILCTGASLAVSGAVMQSLFHNPLASPSVLGISSGGSLLVTAVFALGIHHHYPFSVPLAAFFGSLFTLLIVYLLSCVRGEVHMETLILTGIAVSTLLIAIQGVIAYALRDHWELMQTLAEWQAGSTADRSWKHVHLQLPLTLIGLVGSFCYRREIDIMALGEEEALNLGVDVSKVRWRLFLCVALLTGGTLATVGIIAFFGLVLPHALRRLFGNRCRLLIPFNIFSGSAALLAMDLYLRYFHIHWLTIGNISAIIGGIFFLNLLFTTQRRRASYA